VWGYDPLGASLGIDRAAEGDEWLHLLDVHLADIVSPSGGSRRWIERSAEFPYPHYDVSVQSTRLRSHLRLVPLNGDLYVFVTGEGEPDDEQIHPWVVAIENSRRELGANHPIFEWRAIIGPTPGIEIKYQTLAADAEIGPLHLTSAGVCIDERVALQQPSLGIHGGFWSWPLYVDGSSKGFNWHAAASVAHRDLHRLVCLISVAWDQSWTLRQAPAPLEWGQAAIPDNLVRKPEDEATVAQPATISVPSWLSRAWDIAAHDTGVDRALSVYHEGMLLKERHPSFALVAFTAAVEAVGARIWELPRCGACGVVMKSAERFRNALRLVAPQKADDLGRLYGNRSRTVHAGQLHGSELFFGPLPGLGPFTYDPVLQFSTGEVYDLARAARALLELTLQGTARPRYASLKTDLMPNRRRIMG
jgi:hypothetical protein